MHRVESSAIEALGYNPRERSLHVRFRHTGMYTYWDVPPEVFRAFLAARSKGRFYNQYIRNAYAVERRGAGDGEVPAGLDQ